MRDPIHKRVQQIYKHACMASTDTYHAQTRITTMYSFKHAVYCTHMSVLIVELWASAAAMCCAPLSPMEFPSKLYAHVCEEQHSTRAYLTMRDPTVRGHIPPRAYACQNTNTRAFFARTYLHATALREQAVCCTHLTFWSVELWVNVAAMCCASTFRSCCLSDVLTSSTGVGGILIHLRSQCRVAWIATP
jgi:hypothetical protein